MNASPTKTHSEKGVPFDGRLAMRCGWDDNANPWPKNTWERMRWHAEWWFENADCFKSHVEADAYKPIMPPGEPLTFAYQNWRGAVSTRTVQPIRIEYGATEWHPEAQWLLIAWDIEKGAERSFAVKDINPPAVPPRPLELLDQADDEAMAWVTENLCAIRRDNGSLDYGLTAVVRAFQAGKAASSSTTEVDAVTECPTCGGTGHEARHSICRDCEEPSPHARLTAPAELMAKLETYEEILRLVCHHLELPQSESGPADDIRVYDSALEAADEYTNKADADLALNRDKRFAAEAMVNRLTKALAPFAAEADRIHPDWASERRRASLTPSKELTVGHFREAREAIAAARNCHVAGRA